MRNALCLAGLAGLALSAHASAETIYGLTSLQQIVTFDSVDRAVTRTASPAFNVGGEILLAIDVRPLTGELYGLSSLNRLYKLDPQTGASTPVGSGLGTSLTGSIREIDFNPTVDRIRIVTSSGLNLRANPDTGLVVATDQVLAFASGDTNANDTVRVVASGYTNSVAGATSTTLFNLEATNDVLTTQVPPNDGLLNTVGATGFNLVDSSGFTGFDISGATGTGYVVGNSLFGGGSLTANSLYTINLSTGAATLAGPVSGVSGSFRSIAVANVVPEPATLSLLAGMAVMVLARRAR